MRGSEFVFDGVNALYYDFNKISLNRSKPYIDSSKWLKNRKATVNPNNKDDRCFQYALTVALNHEQIKKDSQRIMKIKPFIDQYNWKEIDFLPHSRNILYVPRNTEKIRHAYKSKLNLKRENKVILLMITDDGEKWHYLTVKRL